MKITTKKEKATSNQGTKLRPPSSRTDSSKRQRADSKQRLKQTLKDSELRYRRRLFETAQDGILILDAQTGAIDDVNPYLIKMLDIRTQSS
jgi:PAS domain-containing protein